jgi:hypothetical protein
MAFDEPAIRYRVVAPLPRYPMARDQVPSHSHMCVAAPGFGGYLFAYQQLQFDVDSSKPDALTPHLRTGRDVVILPH